MCVMAYHNKGDCLDQLGKLDDAVRCYDKAIGIDSENSESWFNKSITLRKLWNARDASYLQKTTVGWPGTFSGDLYAVHVRTLFATCPGHTNPSSPLHLYGDG